MPETPFETFVSRLKEMDRLSSLNGTKGTGRCPVPGHGKGNGDRNPSLSFSEGDDGCLLVTCHTGCSFDEILSSVDMKKFEAFPESVTGNSPSSSNGHASLKQHKYVVEEYIYCDAQGREVARKMRYSDKSFSWTRKGTPGLEGFKPPLYNVHKLYENPESDVLLVEGEKDADTLTELGFIAVSPPNGASKDTQRPKWREEYTEELAGREVYILTDADTSGIAHQLAVAGFLSGREA